MNFWEQLMYHDKVDNTKNIEYMYDRMRPLNLLRNKLHTIQH